ncbi:MAG: CesT family type III secretion system chaperone [Betaproteobacteria bacterium]
MQALPSSVFETLLASFCQSVGLPADPEALGLEFEADGHTVLVSPDPRDDQRLLAEVLVGGFSELPEALFRLLNHLNDAARLEHDWVASVGLAGELRLHTQRSIAQTTPSDLEGLLVDGIERAQALASLATAQPEHADDPASALLAFDPHAGGILRG